MSEYAIQVHSQEGLDGEGQLQSHQWAELPADIATPFSSGGLKHVRRMAERYFSYRFWYGARRVRGSWRDGEPHMRLRFYHLPGLHGRELAHLGRLRLSGTLDVYRGYHEVCGGELISPAAIAARRPWPSDMPWVAPSAGEFIDGEKQRASYLGIFEIRFERSSTGCTLHTLLLDLPPAEHGLAARLWQRSWAPLRQDANAAFLQREITTAAAALGHAVRFAVQEHAGVPARPRFHFDPAPPRVD